MATASRIPQQVRLMHRPPAALKMRAAFHHPQLIQIIICEHEAKAAWCGAMVGLLQNECARHAMRLAGAARVHTLVRLPSAHSIGGWISTRSQTGCAKA
jgi:hypothetical protein